MGLKSDIDEVTQHWSRSPWRVKVFLLIALFISTSSLASLSEAVFKWRGFILDALAFYKIFVSQPLAQAATRIFEVPLPPQFIDGAVLLGLFHAALIRALLLRPTSFGKRLSDIGAFSTTYVAMLYIMANQPQKPNDSSVWLLYPAFLLAAYVLTRGAERILAVAYMLIPVLAVALLAAVSAGLGR